MSTIPIKKGLCSFKFFIDEMYLVAICIDVVVLSTFMHVKHMQFFLETQKVLGGFYSRKTFHCLDSSDPLHTSTLKR